MKKGRVVENGTHEELIKMREVTVKFLMLLQEV